MANWIPSSSVRLSPINRSAIVGGEHLMLHALFIRSLIEEAGVTYATEESHDPKMHDIVSVTVDGLRIGFSLEIHSGMHRIAKVTPDFDAIFVMYGPPEAYAGETVYPFSPSSFGWRYAGADLVGDDWGLYRWAERNVRYTANGSDILAYLGYWRGNSQYRQDAECQLKRQGFTLLDRFLPPEAFLQQVNRCRVAVGCPGLQKFWIDKTVIQLMAVGCCVICPEINYPLPNGGLRDGVHYVRCADDYSDFAERLDANNRRLREIGENAKEYFRAHLTPRPLWEYVQAVARRRKFAGETIKLSKSGLTRVDEVMRDIRHIDRYRRARTYAHGRVLDFGSGSGYGATVVAGSTLVTSVVGLEANHDLVRFSQINNAGERVSFTDRPPQGHFDTVTALEVLEHLPDLEVFRRAVDWAAPQTVIVSFPSAKSRHIVKWHVRDVAPAEIDDLLPDYRLEFSTLVNDGETVFRVYELVNRVVVREGGRAGLSLAGVATGTARLFTKSATAALVVPGLRLAKVNFGA